MIETEGRYTGIDLAIYREAEIALLKWVRAGNKHDPKYRPEGWADWSSDEKNSWLCGVSNALASCGRLRQ